MAVKVQYPGMAEAVEIDLRNLGLLLPLVKRLAPGLDVRALAGELRERVAEELDYEIEAQNHRTIARAWRSHPFAHVPAVHTDLSSRRVLVTELLDGKRFEEVKGLSAAERDRFGEIVFRFFFGTLNHLGRASGDPHPGNYLLLEGGRVGFLDFGLMRVVDPAYLAGEQAIARAGAAGDAAAVHRGMAALGYLPSPGDFDPARLLEQLRVGAEWYFEPGERQITPAYVMGLMERSGEYLDDLRRMTLPPQALLIRRMEGLVFQTLGEVRASADWAAIGAEYHAGRGCLHRARRARRRVLGRPPAARPRRLAQLFAPRAPAASEPARQRHRLQQRVVEDVVRRGEVLTARALHRVEELLPWRLCLCRRRGRRGWALLPELHLSCLGDRRAWTAGAFLAGGASTSDRRCRLSHLATASGGRARRGGRCAWSARAHRRRSRTAR